MHRKRRPKYIESIGKHSFARYPTEAINLIRFLGCFLGKKKVGKGIKRKIKTNAMISSC